MFFVPVADNWLGWVALILDKLLWAYGWVIIIYTLMSWLSPDPYNPIVRFICRLAEPFLDTLRQILPFARIGQIDLTPMLGMVLIWLTQRFVVHALQLQALQLALH